MQNSHRFICSVVCLSIALAVFHVHPSGALPAIVSRASDSISAMLASGRQSSSSAVPAATPAQVNGQTAANTQPEVQQQQQWAPNASGSSIQAHLSAMQTQAQRQISQLNGLVLSGANQLANSPLAAHAANLTGNKYGNVLEVLSNVGKAIQQQIMSGASTNNQIQIITSPSTGNELANTKKNEYQSIVVNEGQQFNSAQPAANGTNYREQGEQLRQEIVRRAGQLQQVVACSMEVLKNNGDLIVRRLLEQLNNRLDQAKSKADKIINEPATNEMAIRALGTINQGLNNINNIITNIVNRLDINVKDSLANNGQARAQPPAGASQRMASSSGSNANTFLDQARLKFNFRQIGQQFSSALNAVQQQQPQLSSSATTGL